MNVGFVHDFRREYQQAIDIFEQVLALEPGSVNARGFLVTSSMQAGLHDKAVAAATAGVEHSGRTPIAIGRLAIAQGGSGNRPAAASLIAELLAMSKGQYVSPGHFAFAYAALGDRDRAFEWLERAYEERANMMVYYPVEPMFDWPEDPRYIRLVAKIRQPHAVRDGS